MSTIKEVAKLAGVSISTVSRTISGNAFVEEETRQKVMKAITTLNYKPNQMARGLRAGKTYTLALMIPDINSLYYPMIMRSIEQEVSKKDYALILCNNNESLETEKKNLEMLLQRKVDGIFCMSVSDDVRHLIAAGREVPVVLLNRNFDDICCVTYDNVDGAYKMVKYLLELGHRKIAGVFGDFRIQRYRDRYDGCKKAMEEYGIKDYKKYFIYDVTNTDEAYLRTIDMLERSDKPTAFFASIDIVAIGIYSAIFKSGLSIPGDISVAGYDNIDISKYLTPPLTTYNASTKTMAQEAVRCMFQLMEYNEASNFEHVMLIGDVKERMSVGTIKCVGAMGGGVENDCKAGNERNGYKRILAEDDDENCGSGA